MPPRRAAAFSAQEINVLHTTLRHRSDQPRILWCRWAGKKETVIMPPWWAAAFSAKEGMSCTTPSHRSEAPIRSAKDLLVQMGRKERNGHHAVAAGCRILGEREKCPSHHLYTPLRHRSYQPRILWCRWAGREETVSMPSWWAAAFSAKVRNVLHTTFTPLRGTDQISRGSNGAEWAGRKEAVIMPPRWATAFSAK